jgi:glucan phosphoethanolaminetransferase (alkaline phosphatase superfamily)
MFYILYELIAGQNPDPTYATVVFPFVGLFTLIFVFVTAAVFYLALGRYKPVWDKMIHWAITLIILLVVAFAFALLNAEAETGESSSYVYRFAFVNVFLAFIYYVVFSLLLKKFSIYAKRTPF